MSIGHFDASHSAEALSILEDEGQSLLGRAHKARRELVEFAFAPLLPDKVARKLVERFPEGALREGVVGFDSFARSGEAVLGAFGDWYSLLVHAAEWRELSLQLLASLSRELGALNFELSPLAVGGYLELACQHARLFLLLGSVLAGPDSKGRLAAAAYCRMHQLVRLSEPPGWLDVSRFIVEFERPLSRLQADFTSRVRLRVADALVPLSPQLAAASDPAYLRSEAVLSPLCPPPKLPGSAAAAAAAAVPGGSGSLRSGRPSEERSSEERDVAHEPPPLLAHLGRVRLWAVYGFLLCPEELSQPGAVELLVAVLRGMYVLPVYADYSILPHTEFEAEAKVVARWIAKKEDAKRFPGLIRESRLAAFRHAPAARASARASLCTKLSLLLSHALDSPTSLASRLPTLVATLQLTRAEVEWWVSHAGAAPKEVPLREREALDRSLFDPATVQALLRYACLLRRLVLREAPVVASSAGTRLSVARLHVLEELLSQLPREKAALPPRAELLLSELPVHLAAAAAPDAQLQGLRLNVLRLVYELSAAPCAALLRRAEALRQLLPELHRLSLLSSAIDQPLRLVDEACDLSPLFASEAKFMQAVYAGALSARPSDCVALLELACAGGVRRPLVDECLGRLSGRFSELLSQTLAALSSRRSGSLGSVAPPGAEASMQAALPKLCALAAALDQSPPLELAADGAATAAARLLPREWMGERLEEHLQQAVRGMLLLPEGKISSPVVVAGQIADLSAALALASHHAGIDLRAALDITMGREFGALSEGGALRDGGEGDGGGGGAGRVRASGLPAQGGAPAGGVKPYLLDALKLWLRTSVDELTGGALTPRANGGGATYLHSRRAFSPGLLCRTQMAALAKVAGRTGVLALSDDLATLGASHAANLRSALQFNRERLQRASEEFDTSRALSPADGMVEMESVARSLHRLGVILAARTIVLAGARDARAEVMPHAVSDFVSVLGAQQLPDYARASSLPPVARLLTEHGAVGDSIDLDADLLAELGAKCDLKTDPALWRLLPQLLAASLQLPPWSSLTADLASDALPNNLHTVAFALHALLSMVDPLMRAPASPSAVAAAAPPPGGGGALVAHRRFVELASLIVQHARAAAHTDEAAAEPLVAGRLLLLEHLARLASPLSPAALLHDVLPHGLTATHNAQAWQAASGAEKKNSFPRTGTGGKRA